MRELVESEIQVRAEQKCPSGLEAQKKYAKQYRTLFWQYGHYSSFQIDEPHRSPLQLWSIYLKIAVICQSGQIISQWTSPKMIVET